MLVTCPDCKRKYDDTYHLTNCPHEYFEMHTHTVRGDGVSKCCHSIEELYDFLESN